LSGVAETAGRAVDVRFGPAAVGRDVDAAAAFLTVVGDVPNPLVRSAKGSEAAPAPIFIELDEEEMERSASGSARLPQSELIPLAPMLELAFCSVLSSPHESPQSPSPGRVDDIAGMDEAGRRLSALLEPFTRLCLVLGKARPAFFGLVVERLRVTGCVSSSLASFQSSKKVSLDHPSLGACLSALDWGAAETGVVAEVAAEEAADCAGGEADEMREGGRTEWELTDFEEEEAEAASEESGAKGNFKAHA